MAAKKQPLGVRQNNPLNLVYVATNKWQGLADPPVVGRFCNFLSTPYGIRAAAVNLIAYQDKHKLNTVAGLIGRWAPHVENDVAAYVASVCRSTGFSPTQQLDLHCLDHIKPLVKAMARHENGGDFFSDEILDTGLRLAGIAAPLKPLAKSKTISGAQTATAGITAGAAIEAIQQASSSIEPLVPYLETLKWVFIGLSLLGVAITVWARLKQRKQGIN